MTMLKNKPTPDPVPDDIVAELTKTDSGYSVNSEWLGELAECSEVVDQSGGKHDSTDLVFVCNIGGDLYRFTSDRSYNDGLDPCDLGATLWPCRATAVAAWSLTTVTDDAPKPTSYEPATAAQVTAIREHVKLELSAFVIWPVSAVDACGRLLAERDRLEAALCARLDCTPDELAMSFEVADEPGSDADPDRSAW